MNDASQLKKTYSVLQRVPGAAVPVCGPDRLYDLRDLIRKLLVKHVLTRLDARLTLNKHEQLSC